MSKIRQESSVQNATLLRELRKRSGLTQAVFADRIGIRRTYLSQLENGSNPIKPWVLVKAREISTPPPSAGTVVVKEGVARLKINPKAGQNAKVPFGERLTRLRETLGYSVAELGQLIEVDGSELQKLERRAAENPSLWLLDRLCLRFNVNLRWLISGEGEMFSEWREAGMATASGPRVSKVSAFGQEFDLDSMPPVAMVEALEMFLDKLVRGTKAEQGAATLASKLTLIELKKRLRGSKP
jgi:transcriptional regulator with XRE-family HTH domain